MEKNKNKKKTLTISSSFSKKFTPTTYGKSTKKSYLIEKKKNVKSSFKSNKNWSSPQNLKDNQSNRNFNIQQQSTLDNDWLKIISVGSTSSTVCVIQNDQGTGTSC